MQRDELRRMNADGCTAKALESRVTGQGSMPSCHVTFQDLGFPNSHDLLLEAIMETLRGVHPEVSSLARRDLRG